MFTVKKKKNLHRALLGQIELILLGNQTMIE